MTAQAGDTLNLKRALRRELRLRRASVSGAARQRAAQAAAEQALRLLEARRCRHIGVYLHVGSELSTTPLIDALRRRGCALYVPVTLAEPGQMRFARFTSHARLRRKRYGIREPASRSAWVMRARLDAVILPLVGFDAQGHRLGTGGGYYDRWLARPRVGRRPLLLGYAFSIQQVERLPLEPWDRRLDAVVTERGVLRWPTG